MLPVKQNWQKCCFVLVCVWGGFMGPRELQEDGGVALLQSLVDGVEEVGLRPGADGVLRHVERVEHLPHLTSGQSP